MSKFILFDIGANWGQDSLRRTMLDTNIECWAFEPNIELCAWLRWCSNEYSDRYHIVDRAVSDYTGTANFNYALQIGCSSLNTFTKNLEQRWRNHARLVVTDTEVVQVTRLDDWFRTHNIVLDKIDYFHCDTQGSDLKVLQGMGDYLSLIRQGVVEAATTVDGKLYNENHTVAETVEYLEQHDFIVTDIVSNDPMNNESNVYFRKR